MAEWRRRHRKRSDLPHRSLASRAPFGEWLEPRIVLAWAPLEPAGSLAYRDAIVGEILATNETDIHTLDLDAGQKMSFRVAGSGGLQPGFLLRAPDNSVLVSNSGVAFNERNLEISLDGTYTIEVSSSGGTTGSYVIDLFQNTDLEIEQFGGSSNDTLATAQSINGTNILLPNGVFRSSVTGGSLGGGSEDWYSFAASDGDPISIAMANLDNSSAARVELYDASQILLAVGTTADSASQLIDGYLDATSNGSNDTYYVRIVAPAAQYQLVVVRRSSFDANEGKAFSIPQDISLSRRVLGHVDDAIGASLAPIATYEGPSATIYVPPDPTMAVGIDRLVAAVNTDIVIYDKATGGQLLRQNMTGTTGFFGSVGAIKEVFDPWVIYDDDPVDPRFFVLAIELSSSTKSSVFIAVSTTGSPTSGTDWFKYKIDFTHTPDGTGLGTGAHFPDYPKFSVTDEAVYVSGNYFPIGAGTGRYAGITALRKNDLLTGGTPTKIYQEYFAGFSVFPLQNYGNNNGTQYFAEATGVSTIRLHAITNILTVPSRQTFNLSVPGYSDPDDAPQLGGGVAADSLDARIMTGVWRNGSAWFGHAVKDAALGDGESVARWYEVATNDFPTASPTLVQVGNVDPGPGISAWIPALAVDDDGNMGIGFATGGPQQFYGAGYTGRLAIDPPGTTIEPFVEYAVGQSNYEVTDGGGRNRWGDYSSLLIDPVDDTTFWVFNEYALAQRDWATKISSFQLDPIPESDWYKFEVAAGETVTLQTFTPFDGPRAPQNDPDLVLELYAPDGTLLETNDNSAPDGRNALINRTLAVGGNYRARIFPKNQTSGDYLFVISPTTSAGTADLTIVDTTPDAGQKVSAFPATYSVILSEGVLATSVQAADLSVDGVPATAVTLVDGQTIRFTIAPAVAHGDGTYNVTMASGSVLSLAGQPLVSGLSTSFTVDSVGPRILATAWNGSPLDANHIVASGPLTFQATISEDVFVAASPRRGAFTPGKDDVILTDTISGKSYAPDTLDYNPTTDLLTAMFTENLPESTYTLRLVSGPLSFSDPVGNPLDGEAIGPGTDGTPTGEGTPGGDYVVNFTTDAIPALPAQVFKRVGPSGGSIARSSNSIGYLHAASDQDLVRFMGQAGQTVAAAVVFDPGVSGTIELVGLSAPIVGAAGETVYLPPTALASDGNVDLRITATGATGYTVDLFLNTALEAIAGDSSPAAKLAIDSSLAQLGTGRYGVIGTATAANPDVDSYTIDLSSRIGQTMDILLDGLLADFSGQTMQLLDPSGSIVASASAGATNFDLGIRDFVLGSSIGNNVYTIRVTSTVAGDYALAIPMWQTFDEELNDATPKRAVNDDFRALGYLALDDRTILEPDDYEEGTVLDDVLPGVHVSLYASGASIVAARAQTFTAPTGSLVFGHPTLGAAGFSLGGDELRLDFEQPVSSATVDAVFTSSNSIVLFIALDQNDQVIGVTSLANQPAGSSQTLVLSHNVADIYAVAGAGFSSPAPLDRVTFTKAVPDPVDTYSVTLNAGTQITIYTDTPFDAAGATPINSLDPNLKVIHPDGTTVVASDLDSRDGKNASVTFTAPVTGSYRVQVGATAGLGEYTLQFDRSLPVAAPDTISLNAGATATTLVGGATTVLANDTGLLDTPVAVSLVTGPAHAAAFVLNPNGTFSYHHDGDPATTDSFVYRVTDYNGQSSTATVTISVTQISTSTPDAVDDLLSVAEGGTATTLAGDATSVLANDTGLADTPIAVSLVTGPVRAAGFSLQDDGTFSYTHDGSENFADSFVYRVTDADGQTDTATVLIDVSKVSDTNPDAVGDAILIEEGGTATSLVGNAVSVLTNDTGLADTPVTVTVFTNPTHASSFVLNPEGTFAYTHDGSENFADSFAYRITDNDGQTDTAVVSITITPVSDSTPQAVGDTIAIFEGGAVTILTTGETNLLANDTGLIDTPIVVTPVSPPAHASTFVLNPTGTFQYIHDGSENFTDSFVYRITDNDGQTSTANVTISITPVSDTVVDAVGDAAHVAEGATVTVLDGGAASVIANDTGLEDIPIQIDLVTGPAHAVPGGFVLHADGTFSYHHDGSENFIDSFVYRLTDNDGDADTATVSITIMPVSDTTPQAADDAIDVGRGETVFVLVGGALTVLANDTGKEDTPIVVTLLTPPNHDSAFILNADGTFSYTHDGSEELTDSFVYRITDNDQQTSVATVLIQVEPTGTATPDAIDDILVVAENATASQLEGGATSVLANDTGLADVPVSVFVLSPPAHAAAFSLESDGTFSYTHDGSEVFTDSFSYRVIDNDGQTDTATVAILITPVSDTTPVAVGDAITVAEGGTATMLATGLISVLANDSGLADTPVVVTIATGPTRSSAFTLNANGTFSYTHNGTENFTDAFVYRITDNDGQTATATVSIAVTKVSDTTPNAVDDEIVVSEGDTVTRLTSGADNLRSNDQGLADTPINYTIVTPPTHDAAFTLNPNGTFSYTHDGSENFTDAFVYRITDNDGQTDTATVHITVTPVSDTTPDAVDDALTVAEGGTATTLDGGEVNLLANDLGLSDTPIVVTLASGPAHGSVTVEPGGTFSYTHDGSENFSDAFVYRLTDNDGQTGTATVNVVITKVSDTTPDAVNDALTVAEGGTATTLTGGAVNLLANDLGLSDTPIVVTLASGPAHGSVTVEPGGTFSYSHDGSENFTDAFVYRITDNDGQTGTATVHITVTPVSDTTPDAVNDALTVAEGGTATTLNGGAVNLLANDLGLSDTPIVVTLASGPAHGGVTVDPGGTFSYTHDGSANFTDAFVYRITDNDGQSDTATVAITITKLNRSSPQAIDDVIQVDEGSAATTLVGGVSTVLSNDVGLNDLPIVVTLESGPTHAADFEFHPDGTFRYEHDGSENFSDSFAYRVTDGDDETSVAEVLIFISPVSDTTPIAVDDTLTVREGEGNLPTSLRNVMLNDQGLKDTPVIASLVSPPAHSATFNFSANGDFTYVHDGSDTPSDSFVYRIRDNDGQTDMATVRISINRSRPDAIPDAIIVNVGAVSSVLVGGMTTVLANDTGLLDAPIEATIAQAPAHAQAFEFHGDGTFSYAPDTSSAATDSFIYRVTDRDGETDTAVVAITIRAAQPPPVVVVADDILVASSQPHTLDAVFSDSEGIDLDSLGSGNLRVTGPDGVELGVVFGEILDATDLSSVHVRYSVTPPLGGWIAENNGDYLVDVVADQVRDAAGNAIPAGRVATFSVAIEAPPRVGQVTLNDGGVPFIGIQTVAIQFDSEVTVGSGALVFVNVATDEPLSVEPSSFSYAPETRIARWSFDTEFPIGRYHLQLLAAEVSGAGGSLDGDLDGFPGADFQAQEPVIVTWRGDTELDLDVDFPDFVVLANNFGVAHGATWQQGDFDGDQDVDFTDFVYLANNFGKSVGGAAASVAPNSAPSLLSTAEAVDDAWAGTDDDELAEWQL